MSHLRFLDPLHSNILNENIHCVFDIHILLLDAHFLLLLNVGFKFDGKWLQFDQTRVNFHLHDVPDPIWLHVVPSDAQQPHIVHPVGEFSGLTEVKLKPFLQ